MESHLILALWSALAMGASLLVIALLLSRRAVTALNLSLEITLMEAVNALTSQKPAFRINPTASGRTATVAELKDLAWEVSDANVATVAETNADHSSAELRPVAAGTVTLTVSGTNKAGARISDSVSVTFEAPVDALNLARTDA